MSRRRYLSSKISQDAKINRLATKHGDFAALLYTWMIPHAEDDGTLSGDPEELLMTVMPGRRDKDVEDIETALNAMHELGLIVWTRDGDHPLVTFPESFYSYQTYITGKRRGTTQAGNDAVPTPQESEDEQTTAQNSAKQRKTAQNASSFKLKLESSFPLENSSSLSGEVSNKLEDVAETATAAAGSASHAWTEPEARRIAKRVAGILRMVNPNIEGLMVTLQQHTCAQPWLEAEAAKCFEFYDEQRPKRKVSIRLFDNWLKRDEEHRRGSVSTASSTSQPLTAEKVLGNGHTTPDAQPPVDALYEFNAARARAKLVS